MFIVAWKKLAPMKYRIPGGERVQDTLESQIKGFIAWHYVLLDAKSSRRSRLLVSTNLHSLTNTTTVEATSNAHVCSSSLIKVCAATSILMGKASRQQQQN